MKKLVTTTLIALSTLTPIASQASTGHRNKDHIASIHFTKDKTHDIALYGGSALLLAGSAMTVKGLSSITAEEAQTVLENSSIWDILTDSEISNALDGRIMASVSDWADPAVSTKLEEAAISKLTSGNSLLQGLGGTGVTIGVISSGGAHAMPTTTQLEHLHAKDGKTIHYRYDKNKSDKEVRTEIKRWLQKKSYLKGFKINTDKFDHGTHTYTYKAGDTWITVKL